MGGDGFWMANLLSLYPKLDMWSRRLDVYIGDIGRSLLYSNRCAVMNFISFLLRDGSSFAELFVSSKIEIYISPSSCECCVDDSEGCWSGAARCVVA